MGFFLTRNKILKINQSNYKLGNKEYNQGLNFVMFAIKKIKNLE